MASRPVVTVYMDISKLVEEPRRSGIQRAERAILRHWPGLAALVPCRYDAEAGRLRVLPGAVRDVLCADAPQGGLAQERAALDAVLGGEADMVAEGAPILCAELFDDPRRAAHLRDRARDVHWIVFDFLPWLHPEWFPAGPANRLMPFLHALRSASSRAFISEATRLDAMRIGLGGEGPVLALGADGLGLERQSFDAGRRDVVILGTIEPRKNVTAAVTAFQRLWREGCDLRLVLIGAVEPDALEERALLADLAGEDRLVVAGPLPDEAVRMALRRARALLFPSEGEGYGLPPMEALAAGVPVIVADSLPALLGVEDAGQIRLARAEPAAIEAALRRILDDSAAAALWREAGRLTLPGWADFAASVAAWVTDGARGPTPA